MKPHETIPQGWKKTTLGSFMDFKNGINADKESYGKGVKFVNIMDIFKKTSLTSQDINGCVSISNKQLEEYSVVKGDILFNRTSETKEAIAFSSVYIGNERITFGGFVIRGRQIKNILLSKYAKYCFTTQKTRKEIIRCCQGAVRSNIGQKDLEKIEIPLPPLPEQHAIADLLCTWDTAIEKTQALIEAKERQFRWLLHTLISKQSPLNTQWKKVKLLGEILTYEQPTKYLVMSTNYMESGKVPVLTANKSFVLGYTNEEKGIFNNLPVIIFDDFTTDKKFVDFPFKVKSSAIKILKPKNNKINIHYVYYAMSKLNLLLGGHKRYWISEYQFLDIVLPPLPEQQRIADILNTAQKEIELLKNIAEQYKQQKKGLMQTLLTGQWRLKPKVLQQYETHAPHQHTVKVHNP